MALKPELVLYIFNHYSHLAPFNMVGGVKYPYLSELEKQWEKEKIAKYVLDNYSSSICINNCPICKRLARTPKGKQCRYCKHDWH